MPNSIDNLPPLTLLGVSCYHGFGFILLENIAQKDIDLLLEKINLVYKGKKLDVRIALDRKDARDKIE